MFTNSLDTMKAEAGYRQDRIAQDIRSTTKRSRRPGRSRPKPAPQDTPPRRPDAA